ncbi:hypothetical protein Bca4012_076618 [Brassica carinata]
MFQLWRTPHREQKLELMWRRSCGCYQSTKESGVKFNIMVTIFLVAESDLLHSLHLTGAACWPRQRRGYGYRL